MSEREEFEKWLNSRIWTCLQQPTERCIERMWIGWQARAQHGADSGEDAPIVWINPDNIRRTMIASPGETVEVSAYREGEFTAPLYTKPPANQVPEGHCLSQAHRLHNQSTGENCSCPKYVRHPECTAHEFRAGLPDRNPWNTTQPDAGAGQWIPFSERLPIGGYYLAFRPDAPPCNRIATIQYDGYMGTWSGQFTVTHYMDLPQPPQGEE